MQTLAERSKAAHEEILPILNKYQVDLGAAAYLTPEGTVSAKPVWLDIAPQEEPAVEAPKEGA